MAEATDAPLDDGSRVSVEPLPGGGLRIDDRIDRRTFTVRTDRDVDPAPVSGDRFKYPLDVAVEFTAGHLELSPIGACFLHGRGRSTEIEFRGHESCSGGTFVVEVSGPIKVYAEVTGPCTVEHEGDELIADIERPGTVVVGARSFHERPATTVTTTEEPIDVMAAVSTFGSELKTRTCKRSYPTLRGHPPALEVGAERSIPAGLDPPEGNVDLEVPPDLEHVLAVAPLAYYLGAAVEPSDSPALVVDGDRYPLDGADDFGATVERTLKRTLFMDCLVRTATPRDVMLHEREQLDGELLVDIDALEGQPAHERLAEYMRVPYETIRPYLPDWRAAAHVQATPAGIEALPFLANDLAIVRVPDAAAVDGRPRKPSDTNGSDGEVGKPSGESAGGMADAAGTCEVIRPPSMDSVRQTWVGPGVPVGATKVLPTAFRNRLARDRRDDGTVEVAVVCNDEGMYSEGDAASEAYGSNQQVPFNVAFHYAADTAELAGVFESDLDYVHYVGHVRDGGFVCADGTLDIASVDGVSVDIAFLNACQSYEQGCKLIEQGAIASVVTFGEVLDDGALRIGTLMARLLNQGFSIDRALSIARARSIVGSQYLVVGDADADIAQAGAHIPWVSSVDTIGEDEYRIEVRPYLTRSTGMGAQFHPEIGTERPVFLVPRKLPPVTATADEVCEYLDSRSFPVIFDGEFMWSGVVVDAL